MILPVEYLQELLTEALSRVPVPQDCGVVLEGSIAEGFGNESSDIDFLVIADGQERFPGTPTVIFLDDRKVDVRVRSTQEVMADASRLMELHERGRSAPAELLNRCQRLRHSVVLQNESVLDPLKSALETSDLEAIVSSHFKSRCQETARLAIAMLALDQLPVAANWARTAVTHAAKSWVASRGETYLEARWIFQQLARVAGGEQVATRYSEVRPEGQGPRQLRSYVTAAMSFVDELGVSGCTPDVNNVLLERQPRVTSWQIHGKTHVLRDARDVLALDEDAGGVWRELVFGASLPEILARTDTEHAGRLIGDFYALGLIGLRWRDGSAIRISPTSPPPSVNLPLLSVGGAVFGAGDEPIKLLPISASRFAAAGMALSWGNVMVESVRQDAAGAITSEQWGVFEIVARRMLCHACLAILSAYGVSPLPALEQACDRLRSLQRLDRKIVEAVDSLEGSMKTDARRHAERLLAQLDELTEMMRGASETGQFPVSFEGTDAWRETLKGLFDWVRIGAYVDAPFPRDDLRDLLQPAPSPDSSG